MARSILFSPSVSNDYTLGAVTGFRLQVTVSAAVGLDVNVFRYLALPLQPNATAQQALFDGVCSPADLVEFPVTQPLPNADPAWFRLAQVDLVFRSRSELDSTLIAIQGEVQTLLDTLDVMDQLTALTPVTLTSQPSP